MTEEIWGTTENFNYVDEGINTGILINGATIPVEVGASFREAIKEASLNAAFGKYRVILNGVEIRPSEAPDTFQSGDMVQIRQYDEAGNGNHCK